MKLIYLTVIGLFLMQCTNTKKESHSSDSTTNKPGSVTQLSGDTTTIKVGSRNDSLVVSIDNKMQELSSVTQSKLKDYYSILTDFTGYEAGSRYTWHFDKSFNLIHCDGSWDAESFGGTYIYYFKEDELIAAVIEEMEQESTMTTAIHQEFKPVYGYSTSTEQPDAITYLKESGYTTANATAKKQFADLLNVLRAHVDSAVVTDNEVTIHIENKVNYGTEFTEEENYRISKPLFEKLIKKQ